MSLVASLFRGLAATLLLLGAVRAEILEQTWPEARGARYDEIGLRYIVGGRLALIPGSRWCRVGANLRELSRAPQATPAGMDVPADLVALLRLEGWLTQAAPAPATTPPKPVPTAPVTYPVVVLDAGHGGNDPGAHGMLGLDEKHVNLDLVKRVRNQLEGRPLIVKLTRTEDVRIDLYDRCDMANRLRASVFVSVHCNTLSKRERIGYIVFEYSGEVSARQRSELRNGDSPPLSQRFPLAEYMPLGRAGPPPVRTHEDLFRWKDQESRKLADAIETFLRHRPANGPTRISENFAVLRGTMAPAVLVETDFLSNPAVEAQMGQESWRDAMARDIANGILRYLGLEPLG